MGSNQNIIWCMCGVRMKTSFFTMKMLIFWYGTVIDVSSDLPQCCNLFPWLFVCSSEFWTYEKLVTLCIFYSLFYTARLMSVCNMITMAEDFCGQLPAQTPVDPDQIKLFFSIFNYMMHLGKKNSLAERSLQRVWYFWEPLGTLKAWLLPGCWSMAQMKTKNFRAMEYLGPRLQPQRILLASSISSEQGSGGLVLWKRGCLSASLLCMHSTRLWALLLAPLSSVRRAVFC